MSNHCQPDFLLTGYLPQAKSLTNVRSALQIFRKRMFGQNAADVLTML